MAELSGLAPLMAILRERTAVGRDALRIAKCARTTAFGRADPGPQAG